MVNTINDRGYKALGELGSVDERKMTGDAPNGVGVGSWMTFGL